MRTYYNYSDQLKRMQTIQSTNQNLKQIPAATKGLTIGERSNKNQVNY